MTETFIQGSAEWLQARCGSLGASRVADAIARIKTGWGASRANIMAELLAERLTGVPTVGFVNSAMAHGTETEPQARAAYEFFTDQQVIEVAIVAHPSIKGTHASPDGLVGTDGLIEIKCPQTAGHVETLLGGALPAKYLTQIQWQLACTERKWVDFVSFDPRMPGNMQLFVKRVDRDDVQIAILEKEVSGFLDELSAKVHALQSLYGAAKAA